MARHFNTAGPNNTDWHYTLPALDRLPEVHQLVRDRTWFVLHAPRQTGKTTAMRELARELTASGDYAALWATCEAGEPFRRDPPAVERIVCDNIATNASLDLPEQLRPPALDAAFAPGAILTGYLRRWCESCNKPVVLLLDEIDALQDEALISVLRQLRSMYPNRPGAAPSSVALIGLRDVRDYKVASGGSPNLGTASPFNIKAESLTLGSFTKAEVAALYGQHAAETGQVFASEAIELAYEYTRGQPWLINALAHQITRKLDVVGTIEAVHVTRAKELLILSRSTHLDSLAAKLDEPRVRAVIAPILTGDQLGLEVPLRDLEYCEDLGLITRGAGRPEIANPIYREVLPRELSYRTGRSIDVPNRRWALADGRLDLPGLLDAFVAFWREHGEWMVRGQAWPEAAHQIVLMAFLQRVVNGGGTIDREYGLGRGRLDLLIRWAVTVDSYGATRVEDRHAIEVKIWRDGQKDPLLKGREQLDGYLQRLDLRSGTLMIFDARASAPTGDDWESRGITSIEETATGRTITVLRL